jgi:hypothetical protein
MIINLQRATRQPNRIKPKAARELVRLPKHTQEDKQFPGNILKAKDE